MQVVMDNTSKQIVPHKIKPIAFLKNKQTETIIYIPRKRQRRTLLQRKGTRSFQSSFASRITCFRSDEIRAWLNVCISISNYRMPKKQTIPTQMKLMSL